MRELLWNICFMVLTATFPIKLPTYCHYALNIVLFPTFLQTICLFLFRRNQGATLPILKTGVQFFPTTLSKILELYILGESSSHIFSDSQFGRGTEIATALVNDVKLFCNSKNSAVYSCSLDAEGAFDAIPHSVLFAKASTALPDYCWHVMVKWYKRLSFQIKWCLVQRLRSVWVQDKGDCRHHFCLICFIKI